MTNVKLPDFNDMIAIANSVGMLYARKLSLDVDIKTGESTVTKEMTTNTSYWQSGKSPSQAYIDNSYKVTGFNSELVPLRKEFAEVSGALETAKLMFDVYRSMIDVWRTESKNERESTLV
jgi:hypothetical protein